MRMTDKQIRKLMDADEPTSTICYHGMSVLSAPENAPFRVIRIIGHLVFDDDDVDPSIVPDHRTVAFDIPMVPETMMHISESLVHAVKCSMSEIDPPFPVPDGEWIPVRNMPDVLKRIFGFPPYDKNGE